jgi:rod shape-determining protein MreC
VLYFIKKYRALLFATALLFSGLVILTGTHENRRDLGILDKIALDVTGLFASAVTWVGDAVGGVWSNYVFLVGLRGENEALRAEIERMRLDLTRLAEVEKEIDRLRGALKFKERTGFTAIPATVIGSDVSGWFRTITIDRGSGDGVERGMAVITPDGIVGRTHEVARGASKVLLITDSNSSVDALVQRTRARGVIGGRVTPVLEMRYVQRAEDVKVEDLVISSGMGGVFPKGLPIGVVVRVEEKSNGLFRTVEVAPAVDVTKLEQVLVVTAFEGKSYEALAAPPQATPDAAGVGRAAPDRAPPGPAGTGSRAPQGTR